MQTRKRLSLGVITFIAAALGTAAGCGGDNGSVPSGDAGRSDVFAETSPESQPGAGDGSAQQDSTASDSNSDSRSNSMDASSSSNDVTVPPGSDASADAVGPADSSSSDAADGGACDQLTRCCAQITKPPPLAAACRSVVQQLDASDAGTCDSLLAMTQDAGLCP